MFPINRMDCNVISSQKFVVARCCGLATALLALIAPGCSSLPPRPDEASTVAALTAQAGRWDQAIVRKDRAAIAANMADDFRQIDGSGNVETKQSFLAELVSPDLQINPYTVEGFNVRLYGDVALLSGRSRLTGQAEGRAFTSSYRYIDIYVRKGGAWRVVSVQISKFPR